MQACMFYTSQEICSQTSFWHYSDIKWVCQMYCSLFVSFVHFDICEKTGWHVSLCRSFEFLVGYYQQCRFVVRWICCLEQKCPVRREMYLCTWSVLESYFGAFVLVSGEYRTPISTCALPYNVLHICISVECGACYVHVEKIFWVWRKTDCGSRW